MTRNFRKLLFLGVSESPAFLQACEFLQEQTELSARIRTWEPPGAKSLLSRKKLYRGHWAEKQHGGRTSGPGAVPVRTCSAAQHRAPEQSSLNNGGCTVLLDSEPGVGCVGLTQRLTHPLGSVCQRVSLCDSSWFCTLTTPALHLLQHKARWHPIPLGSDGDLWLILSNNFGVEKTSPAPGTECAFASLKPPGVLCVLAWKQ